MFLKDKKQVCMDSKKLYEKHVWVLKCLRDSPLCPYNTEQSYMLAIVKEI